MIGRAFSFSKNYTNSLKFLHASEVHFSSVSALQYLASAHLEMANTYFYMNNLDSALILYQKSKKYYETTDNQIALAYIQGSLGNVHFKQNKPKLAMKELSQAINILEELHDYKALTPYYIYASEIELLDNRKTPALNYSQKALQTASKLNNPENKKDAYEQLMKVYAAMGDYEQAYDYQNKYLNLRDSLINMETVTQMANMRADFEIEQKEVEVQQMAASKKMMARIAAITVGSLLLVGILLLMVYRDAHRKKVLNKALLQKQEALRQSKQELEAAIGSKDRLFSIISHDLRGPVGTLGGLSNLLHELLNEGKVKEAGELNASITHTIRQIEFLLNNLLHWSIRQQDIYQPHIERFDLLALTQNVIQVYEQTAQIKNISLALESPLSKLEVEADSNSWGIIIRNLINNALKFTHPGGFVVVRLSVKDQEVVLEVIDNGVGMDPGQLSSLFSISGAQPGWGTKNEKGQGLGLALIHQFVGLHKGRIAVSSKPQKGAHFKVSIPTRVSEQVTEPKSTAKAQTAKLSSWNE
uniref:tetratricopeptide repeat-containing sensor histidine kinase n=1 Tax=Geofilum rhodophaeum TaxID=1965019 RepID=UPI003742A193